MLPLPWFLGRVIVYRYFVDDRSARRSRTLAALVKLKLPSPFSTEQAGSGGFFTSFTSFLYS
jgi:hypothetical protein